MCTNTVLITGASQGIGASIALKLADENFHTILIARNVEKLQNICSLIHKNGGKASFYVCDVSNTQSIETTLDLIQNDFSALPLNLINNAGWGGPFHRTDEVSEAEWDKIFNTNVKSCFLFCRRLLPQMKIQGFGRIVNIASIYGELGGANSSTYSASKHALIGYTKSIAIEWAKFGITANCISPGYLETDMTSAANYLDVSSKAILQQIPSAKMGKPEDVADLAAFLLKPSSTYINGENLVIDGGFSAGFHF